MSSRGRTVVSSVTLAVLIGLSGACGSSKSYTAARNARTAETKAAEAAKVKIANEKRRLAQARQRAAAQRRALAARRAAIAARLRENQRRAAEGTTSTTKPTTTPTPTTSPRPPATAPGPVTDPQDDLAAVRATFDDLNRAFRVGVADGIAASETANYWVSTGVYSGRQCAAFEAAQGGGSVRESLSVHPGSFRADPNWRDPVVGSKPKGRVYALVADNLQTFVPTGEQRRRSSPIHATVMPDGQALLFLRCR